MFDYIIIDAPPLGVFTDANLLMNRADAGLLVLRAKVTRYSVVERLLEQLPRERMLGVVLNRAETKPAPTDYYYQSRPHRIAPETGAEYADSREPDSGPEMIYIEEDHIS